MESVVIALISLSVRYVVFRMLLRYLKDHLLVFLIFARKNTKLTEPAFSKKNVGVNKKGKNPILGVFLKSAHSSASSKGPFNKYVTVEAEGRGSQDS